MTHLDGSRDAVVAALAGAQRTIVAHDQLIASGWSRRVIAHWVNRGRLHVVFRGVYSLVDGELPPLAREQAALLACGERAFLSHATAAFVWQMRKAPPALVEVSVVAREQCRRNGIRVHRIRAVERRELRHHEGLWVSSPARAVLETAAVAPRYELAAVVDEGLGRRLFTPEELKAVTARNRPCRGSRRLAELLGDETVTAISRSKAEKALLRLIRDARLPRPDTNVKFGRYEADFVWHDQRLIVELDSYTFHSGPRAFENDREKDLVFRDAGYDVLRFTRHQVVHEPAMVLVRLVQALARRTRD